MDLFLKKAAENFAQTLGFELKECNDSDIRGYVSQIDINGDRNFSIYVVVPKEKLELVSEVLLGDKYCYDQEDLTKEIANLIVGNSKIVASENGVNYDISTPKYLGEYQNDIEYDEYKCYTVDGVEFFILLKNRRRGDGD
jgi:CheY-specific phosphatase CheX